jgi:corrinoid protein of di/trimethylamine methyltransferase
VGLAWRRPSRIRAKAKKYKQKRHKKAESFLYAECPVDIIENSISTRRARVSTLDDISAFLQKGRANEVKASVMKALEDGISAKSILEDGLMAGMNIIGGKFKRNEVYVPEVLIAARAMNAGLEPLKPHLVSSGVKAKGVVVLGTVKGDLHDIGKNLVKMMMEGAGLEVHDLGVDVPTDRFASAAKEYNANIVACSALLTTTMSEMKNVVEGIKGAGIRDKLIIMVGGAPITDSFCQAIGADIYTADAASAAEAAVAACRKTESGGSK